MLRFISAVFFLVLLVSCDSSQHMLGCVIDSGTKKPIPDVNMSKYWNDESSSLKTEEHGLFFYHGIGGWAPIKVFFYKEGYKTKSCKVKEGFVIIELTKIGANRDSALKLSKKEIFNQVVYGNAAFNPDSSTIITKAEFDDEVALWTRVMQDTSRKFTFPLVQDNYNVRIIKCLNTIYAKKERTVQDIILLKAAREHYYNRFDPYNGWFTVYVDGQEFYPKVKMHHCSQGCIVPPYARYKIVN